MSLVLMDFIRECLRKLGGVAGFESRYYRALVLLLVKSQNLAPISALLIPKILFPSDVVNRNRVQIECGRNISELGTRYHGDPQDGHVVCKLRGLSCRLWTIVRISNGKKTAPLTSRHGQCPSWPPVVNTPAQSSENSSRSVLPAV